MNVNHWFLGCRNSVYSFYMENFKFGHTAEVDEETQKQKAFWWMNEYVNVHEFVIHFVCHLKAYNNKPNVYVLFLCADSWFVYGWLVAEVVALCVCVCAACRLFVCYLHTESSIERKFWFGNRNHYVWVCARLAKMLFMAFVITMPERGIRK